MRSSIYFLIVCFVSTGWLHAQTLTIKGRIMDFDNSSLEGATVMVMNSKVYTFTKADGRFQVLANVGDSVRVSYLGYRNYEFIVRSDSSEYMIYLEASENALEAVIVSTGYQSVPSERMTGSFLQINSKLLNRRVSSDILSRLEDISSGLHFDKRFPGSPGIKIRGESTILSNSSPLIIVDNFPYEGNIRNIDPNDVENVTVLKDAAAASIWGARAGNGVIVITTKRGRFNQPVKVSVNSNTTISELPDLFQDRNYLGASEFIDLEKSLFAQGFYNWMEGNTAYPVMTPVQEILFGMRSGKITDEEGNERIEWFRQQDVRREFRNNLFRKAVSHQHAVNLSGGGERISYYVSSGYSKGGESLIGNHSDRFNISSFTTFKVTPDLDISTQLIYTQTREQFDNGGVSQMVSGGGKGIYPYALLRDENGSSMSIPRDYHSGIHSDPFAKDLLNWEYNPLDDLKERQHRTAGDNIRINASIHYKLTRGLSLEGRYQREKQQTKGIEFYSGRSYFTRNLVNQYAFKDASGQVRFPIPKGGIRNEESIAGLSNSGRIQADYQLKLQKHEINALTGFEIRENRLSSGSLGVYGYDEELLTSQPVDYVTNFLLFPLNYSQRIPFNSHYRSTTDRNVSQYMNASYLYGKKYAFSMSARKDQSNLFGVRVNQRGRPLWSAGGSWQISEERGYPFKKWLPALKLRSTFGYSGNINKSVSAYTTARYTVNRLTSLQQAQIMTPPNPDLRWEKTGLFNVGVDFRTSGNLLSGSVEYYFKRGTDLIGSSPLDPTIGFNVAGRTNFTGNNASLASQGVDVQLNMRKEWGRIGWEISLLYNFNTDKVVKYEFESPLSNYFLQMSPPLINKPRLGIYSYRWAGLNAESGDPQVYLKNEVSSNYALINATRTMDDLVFNGPALPPHFGSLRNTVSFSKFSIGFNIAFKMGHYFRRSSISYTGLYNSWRGHQDYTMRWKIAGDELFTNVPSAPAAGGTTLRDAIYLNSSHLVEKGDVIRLQDINLSYPVSLGKGKKLFNTITFYGYVNNVGILWRANRYGIDPDFVFLSYPNPMTYSLGLTIN